ncbi:MAG: response regulator, partial [Limnohabitans sp.]
MLTPSDATVYIVDDDASVREGMAWLLRTRRLLSSSFDSAESFLAELDVQRSVWTRQAGCILLDVRMPGMSGL